ncbi:peptidoglycan-binding protein [Streptomyces anandii]|uniref:peptidoglycan-binding protein n=1 Tax=Streptomyces anandii TaxID=285454 RepID=UPI00379E19C0
MSTPPGREEPNGGPPIEPVRVIRPRRTDALAELMREFRERNGLDGGRAAGHGAGPGGRQDATEELPPVPPAAPVPPVPSSAPRGPSRPPRRRQPGPASAAGEPWTSGPGGRRGAAPVPPSPPPSSSPDVPGRGLRRAAVALAVAAAALGGFGGALLLPGRGEASTVAEAGTHRPSPSSSAAPASTPAPAPTSSGAGASDPDGPGTLREGDSGPEVTELQQRLLNVPDVYRGGSTSGRYDATLREAVARYQLWYGISGDETGVYGNDTRRSLESRATAGTAGYGGG